MNDDQAVSERVDSISEARSPTRIRPWRTAWWRIRDRVDRWVLGRLVLAVVGVAVVVEGAIVAWRANAATPLLVVGAVLAALGLFNWTELRAKWRDWSLSLLLAGEKIQEVVEREDLAPDVRKELSEAAATISAIGATGATGPTGATGSTVRRSSRIPAGSQPYHKYVGDRQVVLGITGGPLSRYECVVTQPDGRAVAAQAKRLAPSYRSPLEAVFPDDFHDARRPQIDGTYGVDWYATSVAKFLGTATAPHNVGHDEFQLPPSAADALGLR